MILSRYLLDAGGFSEDRGGRQGDVNHREIGRRDPRQKDLYSHLLLLRVKYAEDNHSRKMQVNK
jgi:hypothetical protein